MLKFSKLFKIRNELASLTQNLNICERSLIRSVDNSPKAGNRALLNSSPTGVRLPPISNPYQKNKHFKDLMYHNRLYASDNQNSSSGNIQNSFSMISAIKQNNSYSLSLLNNPLNRKQRSNRIEGILIGKNTHQNNNVFISDSILNPYSNSKNTNNNNNNIKNVSENAEEVISLEKYNTVKTETMGQYRHETLHKEDDEDNGNNNNHNKSIASSGMHNSMSKEITSNNINECSLIQVNIKEKSFINPHDSRDIINTNKLIYDNISSTLIDIQKIFYSKTIKSIDKYHKWRKKMQKVRVSTLVPKNLESIGHNKKSGSSVISETINEEPDRENKEEEVEEVVGEFRDDYMEKKKEKEKLKQKKLQLKKEKEEMKLKNRVLKVDDYELYAKYKYSAKNFPEGREQFSFRYNLVDIVLFGGLLINKSNNYIWTLDPSIFFLFCMLAWLIHLLIKLLKNYFLLNLLI